MPAGKQINRILIIDDDVTTAFLHKLLLDDMAIAQSVDFITDANEALSNIKKTYAEAKLDSAALADLILLDLDMPLMSGFEFMEELSVLALNRKQVYVVMLTASLDPGDRLKAEQMPFKLDGYLIKPLSEPVLHELMHKILV